MRIMMLAFIVFFSTTTFAHVSSSQSEEDLSCFLKFALPNYGKTLGFSIFTLERKGCCSWHSGVCGCSSGRALCCDGSLSPTCGC